jgi:hypothetical protein
MFPLLCRTHDSHAVEPLRLDMDISAALYARGTTCQSPAVFQMPAKQGNGPKQQLLFDVGFN